jgi:hypothetical protein
LGLACLVGAHHLIAAVPSGDDSHLPSTTSQYADSCGHDRVVLRRCHGDKIASQTSTNPAAMTAIGSDSACNAVRSVQGPTDLATVDSKGVFYDASTLDGLATVECEALRPDGSQPGIIGEIKIACQAAGYGYIKSQNAGFPGNYSGSQPTTFTLPTNLLD